MDSRNVTVAVTATVIADQGGKVAPLVVKVQNNGAQTVYVGGSDVSTVNGYRLVAAGVATFTLYAGDKLYGIVAATTAACNVIETYAENAGSDVRGIGGLGDVLGFGNDAAGLVLKNAGDPVSAQDLVTLAYLQAHSGAPGTAKLRGPFAFAFNTPGLTAGVTFYTPTIGDLLLEAWLEITTAFDGTTPKIDIGTFVGTNDGIFKSAGGTALNAAQGLADESAGTGFKRSIAGAVPYSLVSGAGYAGGGSGPGVFTAANPLKVVLSQTGAKSGAAPGGAAGAANIYIVTATPVALP